MTESVNWASSEFRQASLRKITEASKRSGVGVKVNPIDIEEEIFKGSDSEHDYLTRLSKIELGLSSILTTVEGIKEERRPIDKKPNIVQPSHFKIKDENPIKKEANGKSQTPTKVLNPFAVGGSLNNSKNELQERFGRCQRLLQNILQEGSNHNTVYIENCQKLLNKISDPKFVASFRVIESIEKALRINKNDDENEIKIKVENPDASFSSTLENHQEDENEDKVNQTVENQNEEMNQEKPIEDSTKSVNSKTESQQNSSQLENVITQVIEWTLKSSGKPIPAIIPTQQAAQSSELQSRSNVISTPNHGGLKIANVQSINESLLTVRSASLPSISHVQSLVNPSISNAGSLANQPQRSNLSSGPQIANIQSQGKAPEAMLSSGSNNNHTQGLNNPTIIPQTTQTHNLESNGHQNEIQWRKHAKEALFKGIDKLEEDVYKSAGSREKYYQYFKDIFRYAEISLHQNIVKHDFSAMHGAFASSEISKEKELDKLKRILVNEPQQVQTAVKKDWADIDSHLKGLLAVKRPEVDQPSKDIKLLPDEFDMQIDNVLKKVTSSNVP